MASSSIKTLSMGGNTYSLEDTQAREALSGKVDKVSGRGLSENNYTTAEKNKLSGIAAGATANTGTVTGVKMNGVVKGTSGVVDLGTVITEHQDISGKQNTLVSGTNIKTINGQSLLGSGNITVEGGSGSTQGPPGEDGQRGGMFHKVTTLPSSYTTSVNGFTPSYRIALTTVLTQTGHTDVIAGDVIICSYYLYPVGRVDSSYAYLGSRTSIRGEAGTPGADGAASLSELTDTDIDERTLTDGMVLMYDDEKWKAMAQPRPLNFDAAILERITTDAAEATYIFGRGGLRSYIIQPISDGVESISIVLDSRMGEGSLLIDNTLNSEDLAVGVRSLKVGDNEVNKYVLPIEGIEVPAGKCRELSYIAVGEVNNYYGILCYTHKLMIVPNLNT